MAAGCVEKGEEPRAQVYRASARMRRVRRVRWVCGGSGGSGGVGVRPWWILWGGVSVFLLLPVVLK